MLICPFAPLDFGLRLTLAIFLICIGILSILLNSWLLSGLLSRRPIPGGLLILANHVLASILRSFFSGFPFFSPSLIAGRWIFGPKNCHWFAAIGQTLASVQTLLITLLALERAISTSISRKVWPTYACIWPIISCWSAAILWALPPLFGWGGTYQCDESGIVCSLDWISLGLNRSPIINVGIVSTLHLAPVAVEWACMGVLFTFEDLRYINVEHRNLIKITFLIMASTHLVLIPRFILVIMRITYMYDGNINAPSSSLVILTIIGSEITTIIPALSTAIFDRKLFDRKYISSLLMPALINNIGF